MALSAAGIGSGLDVNGIVSQLMALERQPLAVMQQKEADYKSQLSAYGTLKSELAAFQTAAAALKNATTFQSYKASSSNATTLDASAGSTAIAGSHSITVNTLAATQIQAAGTGYASATTALGLTGTLDFAVGATNFSITVAAGDTLTNIQDKINAATGNTIAGASIVNDGSGSPYKLVITAKNSGTANTVTITDGLSSPFAFAQTQAAADASLTVDGIPVTQSSNSVSNVIPGVTLTLKATGTSTVSVSLDTSSISTKVQDFVSAFNKLNNDINAMRMKGGRLEADNTVLSLQSQLRGIFNTAANIAGNSFSSLNHVGISFQKDGTLALDSSKLSGALSSKLNDVIGLFNDSTQGFATRLNARATQLLDTTGLIANRTDGINRTIRSLDQRMASLENRLTQVEARYRKQFSSLDAMIGSMQQTSAQLAQQLASLPS